MKAILAIDMPSSCDECKFESEMLNCGKPMCVATPNRRERIEDDSTRPEWCPLKPTADVIPISFLKDRIALNESWGCYGYAKGLQSAIDEWEKQNEQDE